MHCAAFVDDGCSRVTLLMLSFKDTDLFSAMGRWQSGLCRRLRRQASECWKLRDLCETCRDDLLKGKSRFVLMLFPHSHIQTILNCLLDDTLCVQEHA